METRRWLLPFTWNVDMQAIDAVLYLAKGGEVTLVAASLVVVPDTPGGRGARLEHLQQSRDFLEAVKWKAARLGVQYERHEVFTVEAMRSIATLTYELRCDAIVLVSRSEREVLLHAHQLKHLLADPPASLLVLRLASPTKRQPAKNPVERFLAWVQRCWKLANNVRPEWETLEVDGPLWVRKEEHRSVWACKNKEGRWNA